MIAHEQKKKRREANLPARRTTLSRRSHLGNVPRQGGARKKSKPKMKHLGKAGAKHAPIVRREQKKEKCK